MTTPVLAPARLGYALHHARAGKRVLVVVQLAGQIRPILAWLDRHAEEPTDRVHWGNGAEAYRHRESGGSITFAPLWSLDRSVRGRVDLDVIIVAPSVVLDRRLEAALAALARFSDATIEREEP